MCVGSPVGSLKIDQGFVRDATSNTKDAALIRAIIKMVETFGLDVIAEGVESAEQLAFLQQHGCHLIQGYYFSHPLQQDDFIYFLKCRESRGAVVNVLQ